MLVKKITRPDSMEVLILNFYDTVQWAAEELNWSSNKKESLLESVFLETTNRSLEAWDLYPNYTFFDMEILVDIAIYELNKLIINNYNLIKNQKLAFWIEF